MPELPEVETVRRGLAAWLVGRRISHVTVRRPDLRRPLPPDMGQVLTGRTVERFGRRGKYLLVHLDGGRVLIAHLGMSGRFAIGDAPSGGPHEHVVLHFDDGAVLSFTDHRRFGLMELAESARLEEHALLSGMGPEPLGTDFDGPALARRLEGKDTAIKAALLDQRVVAGLGNIYVCEALYHAGLSPRRRAGSVQGKRAARLAHAIQDVLEKAIAAGGSTLRDYAQASGELGYFQHRFAVYDRAGEPCARPGCGARVKRFAQSGRSTFYCAKCQR